MIGGKRTGLKWWLGGVLLCGVPVATLAAMYLGKVATPPPAVSAKADTNGTKPGNDAPKAGISPQEMSAPIAGFNPAERSKDILAHLSAVIRYYRTTTTPIQKVGEPSDALYRDQAATQAGQVADHAFESAKAEATLIDAYQKKTGGGMLSEPGQQGEVEKLHAARANVANRTTDLKALEASLDQQLDHARANQRAALTQQKADVEGALELTHAMSDALDKIMGMSDTLGSSGLSGDIDRLQRSAPELQANRGKPVSAPVANLEAAGSSGVSSQAVVLFQLLGTRRSIEQWIQQTELLHTQAQQLREPLTTILRTTMQQGNALSQQVQETAPVIKKGLAPMPAEPRNFTTVMATFKALSGAAVPLSQEIILLEQSRANLVAWRTAVNEEYHGILRNLLLRVMAIGVALAVILTLGEVWRRATARYVHDPRRRRQIMTMRRLVVGFLSGLVLIFGFVTQFNSLATFAGFITAGLAVGLQTILLSVAAYFFIVGRYGVRVGDRISVAGVSGDVIDVGLVRFYIMELAGTGTDLHPTGRVAVFSNSVLFQAGTPLYKQMPGTEYAWHELTVKLSSAADYKAAADSLYKAVQSIYNGYRERIEAQHHQMERWMDTTVDAPAITCRLQHVEGGLQLFVRFPVEIREAAQIDEQVTQSVLALMSGDEAVKGAVKETPAIQASVKG